MLIFLDESGDPGFKFDQGSSEYFVVALVIFDEDQHAEQTKDVIVQLRRRLSLRSDFEFKFSSMSDRLRHAFLAAVASSPFRIRTMVVNKRALYSDALIGSKDKFYSYFVSELMQHNSGTISGGRLRIDGSGSREFKKAFQSYLRRKVGGQVIAKFKFLDSKTDSLIQLADMVAGSFYRAYRTGGQDKAFLNRLKGRLEDCWEFDRKSWPAP